MIFFVGSYTRLGGPGVARCRLADGHIAIERTDPLPDSLYVLLNRAHTRLYAASMAPAGGGAGGSVAAYDVTGDRLARLCHRDALGAEPCHLCLDPEERFLYAANYASGSVSAFPVLADGTLGPCLQHIRHQGRGVHSRQEQAHVHQVLFMSGTRMLCAVDLGLDRIILYRQAADGCLTHVDEVRLPDGCGPRHLLFGPGDMAYLTCELSCQLAVLRREGDMLRLTAMLPTLPGGVAEGATAAALRLSPDGRRLMVSNRGEDAFAVYDLNAEGMPTLARMLPATDRFPRDFVMVGDGALLAAYQKGRLALLRVTGAGLETAAQVDLLGSVCVCPME